MDEAWVKGQMDSGNPGHLAARFYAKIVETLESPSIVGTPLVCVRGGVGACSQAI